MKLSLTLFSCSISLLASTVLSHGTEHPQRICQEYEIPVNVSTQVFVPSFAPFKDNYEVANLVGRIARRDSSTSFVPFSGGKNVTVSYNISATFCTPVTSTGKEQTVLLATHGLGFDRRYWDSSIEPESYNFVDYAISRGYSVFFYDRLGTGKSSKVSGYDEAQASIQLAILQQLTVFLRSGKYTSNLGAPSKIVHVGHSFGSYLSNALVATTPDLSDAVILTGLAYDNGGAIGAFIEAFGLRIATQQAPGKWIGRDNSYLTWGDAVANSATFFHGESYDKEVLWHTEAVKQPLGIIEVLTLFTLPTLADKFTRPAMIISGEFDFAVCGGNCRLALKDSSSNFPNAVDFQAVVHPGVGHGINFSYNATGAYSAVLDYLNMNGL